MIRSAVLAFGLGLLLAVLRPSAPSQAADDPLVGFWRYHVTYGHALEGSLTIQRDGKGWVARIKGAEARTEGPASALVFHFPAQQGEFRGALSGDRRRIRGFWLQPSGATAERPHPAPAGQPFASPLTLTATGKDAWRGTVRPLLDEFTLWLRISRRDDGVLVAAFRNPQYNTRGGAGQFRVGQDGDKVVFSAGDPVRPNPVLTASLLAAPDRLRIRWRELERDIDLERIPANETDGYFPRPPGAPPYVYARPPRLNDGWPTARARDVGLDEAGLQGLVRRIAASDPGAPRPTLIQSVLVARKGRLVLEEYFFGQTRETAHDIRSAGKTFSSILLGALMHDGADIGPETRLYGLLGGDHANPDPRKAWITLGEAMSHTTGLACDDNDDASPGGEEALQTQTAQPDWWRATLDLPMAHDPGTRYAYCSMGMNLMGAALTKASGEWLPALFDREIARPLRFGPYWWNLMPTGEGYLGGGAFMRPRDLLKVGQLYADGGVWQGRRIVDAAWIERSTAAQIDVTPATTGLSDDDFHNVYIGGADGFAWHLSTLTVKGRAYREYAATGNGGQLLIVVPELDLVVVFTAANYGQGGIWGHYRDQIVPNDIIAGIRGA